MRDHDENPMMGGDEQATPDVEPAGVPVGHAGARVDVAERRAWSTNGLIGLAVVVALILGGVFAAITVGWALAAGAENTGGVVLAVLLWFLAAVLGTAITVVDPGETRVVQLFGRYIGTLRADGLQMTLPLVTRRKVSVKVRNFETNELKVNDADGNPVNIAGIIVWQVADTAKAVFAVEKFTDFVAVQSEAALRHVASSHPYDNAGPGEESLRGSTEVVAKELAEEVAARIAIAGLEVVEARISSLAYAPEIAHAMLQRQQAAAVVAAREKIVEGAVSMVQGALRQLEIQDVVVLDEERKAAMVSNLLVVLCGSTAATPVVNTGSLYT